MARICRFWTVFAVLALPFLSLSARATHRADFFDISEKPEITYDKGSMTWTLSNAAIERQIRFDAKLGGLRTLSFRDLKHKTELRHAPGSEGTLVFAAPLLEPPTALKEWKFTETAPPAQWTQPGFVDAAWKPADTPLTLGSGKPTWLRCLIPSSLMKEKRAYALILEHAFTGDAEIYVDDTLAMKISGADRPEKRLYQIDLTPANRVIGIKLTGKGAGGFIGIAEEGTAPPNVELDSNWHFMNQSINAGDDGSRILTISLSGLKQYDGFDIDVNYQIYAGQEPYIAKWYNFVSHRTTRFLIEQVVYDRWLLPGSQTETQMFPGTGFTASDPVTRAGLITAVLSPAGASDLSADKKTVTTTLRPYALVKAEEVRQTPKAVVGLYRGTLRTGAFLYQLYCGQYVAYGSPTNVPTLYSTRYGYGATIGAKMCEKIIPIAANLGAKLFVLDNGWQTNLANYDGTLGDWNVDRSADKFPQGLNPISILVRERNMRFGLWATPTLAAERSQAAMEHSDWLLKNPDGTYTRYGDKLLGMCFTSGWEENFAKSMELLCRELTVSYLQLDGSLFMEDCASATHEHPVLHSLMAQSEHWGLFGQKIRKVSQNFLLSRGADAAPEATDIADAGSLAAWTVANDPKKPVDARAWMQNADAMRHSMISLLPVRPAFTLSAGAPCHISTTPDLNALEYHLTSAAALTCNLELHGRLDQMTLSEQNLVAKWVKWNEDNRPWLAYSQPLTSSGSSPVDGIMHLRPVLQGRYGYICLWNGGDSPQKASLSLTPSDYFLRVNPNDFQIVRMKDGKPVKIASRTETALTLDAPIDARSWEIYEVRQR